EALPASDSGEHEREQENLGEFQSDEIPPKLREKRRLVPSLKSCELMIEMWNVLMAKMSSERASGQFSAQAVPQPSSAGHGEDFSCAIEDESALPLKSSSWKKSKNELEVMNLTFEVKPDYDHLRETLLRVTQERDLAVRGKHQLQAKLENLEQVLKAEFGCGTGRNGAGGSGTLQDREGHWGLWRVQPASLSSSENPNPMELQQHSGLPEELGSAKSQTSHLLGAGKAPASPAAAPGTPGTPLCHPGHDSCHGRSTAQAQIHNSEFAKVRELEEKCRTQGEQFNLLARELERFRQQAGKIELLGTPLAPPGKPLAQLMNGIATSIGKGHESPAGSRCVISEFIRPLQISGDKPEQLPVKPTFLSKARSATPRCRFDSDMDNDQNSNTSKQRYSGKVHLCIARYRYSTHPIPDAINTHCYNPFDGPNENPEAELPLTAGKYLYVYGDMDEDGFYEGELLDGQRGLVPSNFVDFVQDSEAQEQHSPAHPGPLLELSPPGQRPPGGLSNGQDINIDQIGEDIVPYPRRITLIKQLAKSVIVGWEPPLVPPGWGSVSSYNVLVDREVRMNVALGSRTKALIEKLNISTCTYRISIQSITSKGSSDELQCTLLVGKDVIVAPSNLRVDNITQISAELSWLPTNSNYSHVIFLNEEEFDIVKAASYKYHFFNLKPNMAYKVKVMAKPHQMPWQLPLEQREKKEAFVEFSTLPAGVLRMEFSGSKPEKCTGNLPGISLRSLDAREVTVRTLSAQGESLDSCAAAIPSDLLVPPTPHPRPAPKSKPLASAGAPETKEEHLGPHFKRDESWEQTRSVSPAHGHMLEPPNFHGPLQGRRSPSPNRILPQPQGTPVPNTVAKAMAREAAQRVAESSRMERRSVFSDRSSVAPYSDEEEDGYDSPRVKRRGASVDDFLKESELGKQAHYCPGDEYHTESSRGSDLSDILEEDEEELYSEMQLEEGGRRRLSLTSHGTLKDYDKNKSTEAPFWEQPDFPQQTHHSKRLFSIPEVAEEDGEYSELLYKQGLGMPYRKNPRVARGCRAHRPCRQEQQHSPRHPAKLRMVPGMEEMALDEPGGKSRQSRSPDSGLDCGSEEEEPRFGVRPQWGSEEEEPRFGVRPQWGSEEEQPWSSSRPQWGTQEEQPWSSSRPQWGTQEEQPWSSSRLTPGSEDEQSRHSSRSQWGSEEEEPRFGVRPQWGSEEEEHPQHSSRPQWGSEEEQLWHSFRHKTGTEEQPWHSSRLTPGSKDEQTRHSSRSQRGSVPCQMCPARCALPGVPRQVCPARCAPPGVPRQVCIARCAPPGNPASAGRPDRVEHVGRRSSHGSAGPPRARPLLVPPIDGYGGHDHLSPDIYEESETDPGTEDLSTRIFVALFDYDPLTMSPNPDAAEEELPFKEGQIIKVYGDKDADGFYRGETCTRIGLIPCNMVSEIQADDEEMMDQLLKQGFLPLNTPIEKIVTGSNCVSLPHPALLVARAERGRRGGRQQAVTVTTRRMVALYDYDPRESSPNVDVEAELTFCTGDIITVFGEIDEDGFYYGELNGQKGLVPSNFLEEVPDDVEVFLSDAPSRYVHDTPMRSKAKRCVGATQPFFTVWLTMKKSYLQRATTTVWHTTALCFRKMQLPRLLARAASVTCAGTHHSGLVTTVSTTVPGGGFLSPPPISAKNLAPTRFFTTITVSLGLKERKSEQPRTAAISREHTHMLGLFMRMPMDGRVGHVVVAAGVDEQPAVHGHGADQRHAPRLLGPVSKLGVFLGQEEDGAIEGVCLADGLLVLEEQGGAQAPRLHLGAVAHVVLVQSPLRPPINIMSSTIAFALL
ncbi:RIMS-binding protein 2, partial [Lamprotornis superbus]